MVSCRRAIAASVSLLAGFSRRSLAVMASAGHRVRHDKGGTIVVEPAAGGATATVILMHGLGDTADGWESSATDFLGPALPHARFILPTAPTRPITVNGGMHMPGWYDIEALGADAARSRERAEGIVASRKRITSLIKAERDDGIPANRIVLAGFSQGGAMSLFTGLNFPETLGGILVMSGYLPAPSELAPTPAGLRTPILFLHGSGDEVVPEALARDALARVTALGCSPAPEIRVYPRMPHTATAAELRDAAAWLVARLPATPPIV